MHERSEQIADIAAMISDGQIDEPERAFTWRLAVLLEVPTQEVVSHIGLEWPARTTRPTARSRPHV